MTRTLILGGTGLSRSDELALLDEWRERDTVRSPR